MKIASPRISASSNSGHAVICVYEAAGNVIETHEHKGDFKRAVASETKSRHLIRSSDP
jgi:hypothetical protein